MICATPTLAELVRLYILHHPCLKSGSRYLYGRSVGSLESHYGYELRACDFADDVILPWLSWRLGTASAKTVKRERGDLLTLWRFAFKQGLCQNPPIDVPTVKIPRRSPNSWTVEEYQRIVAVCDLLQGDMRGLPISKAMWWRTLVTFLYWIGCRIGAALAVTPSDVNLDRRLVRLAADDAKTDLEQVLLLSPQAADTLRTMLAFGRPTIWEYPYSRRHIWEEYKAILALAGLPNDRSHMFQKTRRTTYTQCVKHGSKEIASKQLGHKTDMSRFYLDESQLDITQAANLLPQL